MVHATLSVCTFSFARFGKNVAAEVQKWLLRMKTSWIEEFEKYWDESVEKLLINAFGSVNLDTQLRGDMLIPWRNTHAAAILETFVMKKEKK